MDFAVDDGDQPEHPDPPPTSATDQAEQCAKEIDHPGHILDCPEGRAELWSNTSAYTSKTTDQAGQSSIDRDHPEHSGDCPNAQAELWSSANVHRDQATDQAEQCQAKQQSSTNVQQEAAAGEMATNV